MDKKRKESLDSEQMKPVFIEKAIGAFLERRLAGKVDDNKYVVVESGFYGRACADFKVGNTYVDVKIVKAGLSKASIGNVQITSLCRAFCRNMGGGNALLKEEGAKYVLLLVFQETLDAEMKDALCGEMKKHMKMEGGRGCRTLDR